MSNQHGPGPPLIALELACKKHYLKAKATGALIFTDVEDAAWAARVFNGNNGQMRPGRKSFGREAFFKCRLNKHWLYKPTPREKEYFDEVAITEIMIV